MTIDDIGFCQSFEHSSALVVVWYGFHGLKGITLGSVDKAEHEVGIASDEYGIEVALKLGQESFRTMLIEVETAVGKLSCHGQGEVCGADTHRQVGTFLFCLSHDVGPTLLAHEAVVVHQFIFL